MNQILGKYIPISHLSIEKFSSETPKNNEYAINSIDGNINTMWHTIHDGTDKDNYIVIKLDEPKYISKVQYTRKPGYAWGVMKDAVVYTSLDGENWTEVGRISECEKNDIAKEIVLNESTYAQYVKIQITSHDGVFASASMINLFEDVTKLETDEPVEPGTTDEPDVPDNPVIPDDPVVPDEPTNPDVPDEPDTPVEPDNPEKPDIPDAPINPAISDEPKAFLWRRKNTV